MKATDQLKRWSGVGGPEANDCECRRTQGRERSQIDGELETCDQPQSQASVGAHHPQRQGASGEVEEPLASRWGGDGGADDVGASGQSSTQREAIAATKRRARVSARSLIRSSIPLRASPHQSKN